MGNRVMVKGRMGAMQDWIKVNSTIGLYLSSGEAKRLGAALLEAQEGKGPISLEIQFPGSLEMTLEAQWS